MIDESLQDLTKYLWSTCISVLKYIKRDWLNPIYSFHTIIFCSALTDFEKLLSNYNKYFPVLLNLTKTHSQPLNSNISQQKKKMNWVTFSPVNQSTGQLTYCKVWVNVSSTVISLQGSVCFLLLVTHVDQRLRETDDDAAADSFYKC